jgi:CHAT domain-containing protein
VPPTENDGIVTAEEVGRLKLNDTWLVVLSAGDTGTGEAKAGEGVMGCAAVLFKPADKIS